MILYNFENVNRKRLILEILTDDRFSQFNLRTSTNNCTRNLIIICTILIFIVIGHIYNYFSIIHLLICLFIGIMLIFNLVHTVKEENLLLVPLLGCQITCKQYIGERTRYIPWELIDNIFINEVISKQRILFMLTLSTTTSKLVPLFTNTLPRLDCLELIYRQINGTKNV